MKATLKISRDKKNKIMPNDSVTIMGQRFVFGEDVAIGATPFESAFNLFVAIQEGGKVKVRINKDEKFVYIIVECMPNVSETLTSVFNVWEE